MNNLNHKVYTLGEFTIQQTKGFPNATGELSGLLRDIGLAAKRINVEVNKAGLADIIGNAGTINIQGEDVKKLDLFANTQFIGVLQNGISCAGIVSEEMDDFVAFDDVENRNSKYVCLFDPLDGSGNIDVNVAIGTIFSVYRRVTPKGSRAELEDFLQPGDKQVAAGYIVYGSSTMLVYATRRSVNGFTLDPSIGEFCLSHPDMKCPEHGNIYSVNHGSFFEYSKGVQKYIDACQRKKAAEGGPYTQRYCGSMVSDLHRNIVKGGIFMYPALDGHPNGKLRLMYECNPFAYIMKVAGGMATDGTKNILEIQPTSIHQRSPLFIGSKHMMKELESCLDPGH